MTPVFREPVTGTAPVEWAFDATRSDALVIGAGPAGAACALALVRAGLSVVLVERGVTTELRVGETVPGVVRELLGLLGLADEFTRAGHEPAHELRAFWGSQQPRERNSLFDRHGHGYHLDRARFDDWLRVHAIAAGARWLCRAEVLGVERATGGVRVELRAQGKRGTLFAGAVIDATGRSAFVGRRLGALRRQLHAMVGVARWFATGRVEPSTVIEAVPDGWWYSAPLPNHRVVVTFMTDAKTSAARAGRDEALFVRELLGTRIAAARTAGAVALSTARTSPTGPAFTSYPSCHDFLPIGDAACSFDPISGTGLCFALRSAIDGAEVVAEGLGGRPRAFAEYREGLRQVMVGHLAERRAAYQLEQRFPTSAFWTAASRDLAPELPVL